MDHHRFTALSEIVTNAPSRRHVLHGLAGLGLGLGATWLPADADAKKKKKKTKKIPFCLDGQTVEASGKKKKKLLKGGATAGACASSPPPPPPPPPGVPNAFGCLSVDVPCASAAECCSNICENGVCKAHGTGTCPAGVPGVCAPDNPSLTFCNSDQCLCFRTTADSMFCGELFDPTHSQCVECRKDADCLGLGFPQGTACVPMTEKLCSGQCPATGSACMLPCGTELPAPFPAPAPAAPRNSILNGARMDR